MTQAVLRTHFNSSRFIHFLADLAVADAVESQQAFAQRLGQWVSFTDAATLYSALDSNGATTPCLAPKAPAGVQSTAARVANEELNRVRTTLADLINRSCASTPGEARIKFPIPKPDTPLEIALMYSPFHRFYQAVQRELDTKIGPLRSTVREALASASPALRQLATLDAALDGILSDRERRLFSTVPALLEKRFAHLRNAHQQTLMQVGSIDEPAAWTQPGAWLARFRDELRGILLAELDVRLQPALGLVEAFSNKMNEQT